MTLLFGLAAMLRGAHWAATPAEVKPWSAEAANLLERVPVSVAERALDASSAVAVAVGVGTMVSRRVAIDAALMAQARTTQAQRPATTRNAPTGANTPPPAPAARTGDPAAPDAQAPEPVANTAPVVSLAGILA